MLHGPRHIFFFTLHDDVDFLHRLHDGISPVLPIENVAAVHIEPKTVFEMEHEGNLAWTDAEALQVLDICRDLIQRHPRADEIQHGGCRLRVSPDDPKCVRLEVDRGDYLLRIALIGVGWTPYDPELRRFNMPRLGTKAYAFWHAEVQS